MKVKFIVREPSINQEEWRNDINSHRYSSFNEELNEHNVTYISFEEAMNEIENGPNAKNFKFDSHKKDFVLDNLEKGLCADLVIVESHESSRPITFSEKKEKTTKFAEYFSNLIHKNLVGNVVNSLDSIPSQDKIWLLDIQNNFPSIKLPKTYFFGSPEEINGVGNDLVVIKPRLGLAGRGIELISLDQIRNIRNIHEYIIQENISPLDAEIRLIFGPNERYMGGRILYDRPLPWEHEARTGVPHNRKKLFLEFKPSIDLIVQSAELANFSKSEVCSVDYMVKLGEKPVKETGNLISEIISKNSETYFAEINGFGTNFGPRISPYDLNKDVIRLIREKYLEK